VPQNFLYPQRDQPLLLPVDMCEWLPEDDLVFVVLDAVAALDLGGFYRSYRADGHCRAARRLRWPSLRGTALVSYLVKTVRHTTTR
jgi:hypothetical protein